MAEWKQNGKYPESMFGIDFRETYPNFAKQLSDERGFYINGKEFTEGKWTFKAKQVTSKKDSKQYWFVERIPVLGEKSEEQKAADSVRQEYADGQKKGHQENIDMHKAQMAKLDLLIVAIQNLTESVNTNTEELRRAKAE